MKSVDYVDYFFSYTRVKEDYYYYYYYREKENRHSDTGKKGGPLPPSPNVPSNQS